MSNPNIDRKWEEVERERARVRTDNEKNKNTIETLKKIINSNQDTRQKFTDLENEKKKEWEKIESKMSKMNDTDKLIFKKYIDALSLKIIEIMQNKGIDRIDKDLRKNGVEKFESEFLKEVRVSFESDLTNIFK